jgi:hypothetical protein
MAIFELKWTSVVCYILTTVCQTPKTSPWIHDPIIDLSIDRHFHNLQTSLQHLLPPPATLPRPFPGTSNTSVPSVLRPQWRAAPETERVA